MSEIINNANKVIACHHCDYLVSLPPLAADEQAQCPACGAHFAIGLSNRSQQLLAISLVGIVLLTCALFSPLMTLQRQNFVQSITLLDVAKELVHFDYLYLAVLTNISIFGIQLVYLLTIFAAHSGMLARMPAKLARQLVKLLLVFEKWSMAEIFLVAILVSLVKLHSVADVTIGLSFWAFSLYAVCVLYITWGRDPHLLWQGIAAAEPEKMPTSSPTVGYRAIDGGLRSCPMCQTLTVLDRCPRCAHRLQLRKKNALQKVMALTLSAFITYIPANIYPILSYSSIAGVTPSTIIGGIITLWQIKSYPIAIIIFIASVIVPLLKIILMFWLCFAVQSTAPQNTKVNIQLYEFIEFIGKWSMLDVFVVGLLVALVQFGVLSILPGPGAIYFSLTVILSMFAAQAFDPRLLWDGRGLKTKQNL